MPTKIDLIKADIDRYVSNPDYRNLKFPKGNSTFAYFIKLLILFFRYQSHGFRYVFYLRIGKWSRILKIFFRVPYPVTHVNCTDVEGGGIFFGHPWNTGITCQHIGYGCSFMQNTVIGNKPKNGKAGFPYLERNVKVGASCIIIGDVHIGNNVNIGAGCVVTKDVPDNCTVVGNPARIVKKDGVRVDIPL